MKKAEKIRAIIDKLNKIGVSKIDAIKNRKFEEAFQLRDKEKTLIEQYQKLTGRLPERDPSTGGDYTRYIKEPLDPDKEQKYWKDLHTEASAQEKKKMQKSSGGVTLGLPVHLNPNNPVTAVDWDVPEKERIYVVKNSRNSYRKFDGDHHRHCSKCPFPEGCVMCTLP